MSQKKDFETRFGVSIPSGDQPVSTNALMQVLVSIGTKMDNDNTKMAQDVSEIKTDVDGIKSEFREVKSKVTTITDTVESLKKRIEELKRNADPRGTVDYNVAAAVEEARRIIVFTKIPGYTQDREVMTRKMKDVYDNFRIPEEFQRVISGARYFQTNAGKTSESVHVEYDSPYQAKRVLTLTKGANSWVGRDTRIDTRIFIPGALYERQNELEKLAAQMRERGKQSGQPKVSTQLRYVQADLALFVRLTDLSTEWHPVNRSSEAEDAIEEVKESIKIKENQKRREQERRNNVGKTQQNERKRKNTAEVGRGATFADTVKGVSFAQTDGLEDENGRDCNNLDCRETPRRSQEVKGKRGITLFSTPLFHHDYQPKPILKTHRPPKDVQDSRIKIVTIEDENVMNDLNNVLSVDGSTDNKQITLPQMNLRRENNVARHPSTGTSTYALNQPKLLDKQAEKFLNIPPYDPKYGDLKNGKHKSITLICNGVYHEVFKNKLLNDLTVGWTKVLNNGELLVDGVEPKRDKNGVLERTQIYIRWRSGGNQKKVTAHVFHTTRNIRLQGVSAQDFWEKTIKPMFDKIIETDTQAKNLQELARQDPRQAAAASASSLGATTLSSGATSDTTPSLTPGRRPNTPRLQNSEVKKLCVVCGKGNCRLNEKCDECGRLGHRQCGWMVLEGRCKDCRAEATRRQVDSSLHLAAGTLATLTEKTRTEEREQKKNLITTPVSKMTVPAATPATIPTTPTELTAQVLEMARHDDWDGHLSEVMDLDTYTPRRPTPRSRAEAIRTLLEVEAPETREVANFGDQDYQHQQRQAPPPPPPQVGTKPHQVPEVDEDGMLVSQLLKEIAILRHENQSMTTALENHRRAAASRAMKELGDHQKQETSPVVVNNKLSVNVTAENLTTEKIVATTLTAKNGVKDGVKDKTEDPPGEDNESEEDEEDKNDEEIEKLMAPFEHPDSPRSQTSMSPPPVTE